MKKFTIGLYVGLLLLIIVSYSDFQYDQFFNINIFLNVFRGTKFILYVKLVIFICLLIISFQLIKWIKKNNNDENLSTLELFLFVFGIYYTISGFLNAIVTSDFSRIPLAIDMAMDNDILCLIIVMISYLSFNFINSLKTPSTVREITIIDLDKLRISAIILFVASMIGILLFWKNYGAIPVFSGFGIANINMDISEKMPIVVTYLNDLLPIYALYIGIYYIIRKKKDYLITSLLILLFIMLALNGVRFPLLVSFILSFTLIYPVIKQNKKYIIQIALILIIVYSILGVWRNRDTSVIAAPGVLMVAGQVGVEFSEYCRLLSVLNKPTYIPSDKSKSEIIFDNIIIPSLPSSVWSVFGIDRNAFRALTYVTFGKLIYNITYTGIRPGIFGEIYYGFGIPGLIVSSICLAFLMNYFDNKRRYYQSFPQDSFHYIITNLWGVILVLTVFNQLNNTVHFFTTSFVMFYLVYSYSKGEIIISE